MEVRRIGRQDVGRREGGRVCKVEVISSGVEIWYPISKLRIILHRTTYGDGRREEVGSGDHFKDCRELQTNLSSARKQPVEYSKHERWCDLFLVSRVV